MSKKKRRRGMVAAVLGAGPTSDIRHPTWVLAGVAIMVFTAAAGASPIRFDNPAYGEPGHYHWPTTVGDETHWLDVTQPPSYQPAPLDDPIALKEQKTTTSMVRGAAGGAEVERGGMADLFLQGLDAGDLIPSGLSWGQSGYINYPGYEEEGLPEGVPTYFGMRFDPGDGLHYGWVGGVRDGFDFDAFAWGYETEVGVPIPAGIPEPGTLALLAFGAAAVAGRRRRA